MLRTNTDPSEHVVRVNKAVCEHQERNGVDAVWKITQV